MNTHQIVITVLVALTFAACIFYLLYWRNRLVLPEGHRIGFDFDGTAVHIIFDKKHITPDAAESVRTMGAVKAAMHGTLHVFNTYVSRVGVSVIHKGTPNVSTTTATTHRERLSDRVEELYVIFTREGLEHAYAGLYGSVKSKIGRRRAPVLYVNAPPLPTTDRITALTVHEAMHLMAVLRSDHPDASHEIPEYWTTFENAAMSVARKYL